MPQHASSAAPTMAQGSIKGGGPGGGAASALPRRTPGVRRLVAPRFCLCLLVGTLMALVVYMYSELRHYKQHSTTTIATTTPASSRPCPAAAGERVQLSVPRMRRHAPGSQRAPRRVLAAGKGCEHGHGPKGAAWAGLAATSYSARFSPPSLLWTTRAGTPPLDTPSVPTAPTKTSAAAPSRAGDCVPARNRRAGACQAAHSCVCVHVRAAG